MTIDITLVERLAKLARLDFSDAEKPQLADELSTILDYVEQLNEIDTDGIEPLSHPMELSNVLRDDLPTPSLSQEEALANAPDSRAGFFKVPKVIK